MKILRDRTKHGPATRLSADASRHLPLRPVAFAVLATLAEGPRIGIDVLDQVNATVPGRPLLGPGTLYRLLRELRQDGLLTRTEPAGGREDDRHSHHVLTPLGAAVLEAEVARLRRTIDLASPPNPEKARR